MSVNEVDVNEVDVNEADVNDVEVRAAHAVAVVQRWKRFGHDRAYVRVEGRDVGYRDLRSGEVRCAESDVELVTRATDDLYARVEPALERYSPKHSVPDGVAASRPTSRPNRRQTGSQPDRDLALNVPGQAARQRATQLRAAAPIRTFLQRAVDARTDERSWRIGADGERDVARRLAKLGPDWSLLHAVPIGTRGSDIDHVVIGPAGVFTVNTKNHPQAQVWVAGDTVKVNGSDQPYIRNSRHEAARAAALVSAASGVDVHVRGIVAVVGAHRGFTVKEQPRDGRVVVVSRKGLLAYLRELPEHLDAAEVAHLYEAARHLATWQSSTVGRTGF